MIHQDRFNFGDIVTWRDEDKATNTGGRDRFGTRVTIKDTKDVPYASIRHTGHTQWITIQEDPRAGFSHDQSCFSGAFFRHLAPWER